MLKNFFTVAWRNLMRGKGFSLINISGLATGMASALLILLWVQYEFSYDNFYANKDRLYQAWRRTKGSEGITTWNITPQIFAPGVKREFPEVEGACRVFWDQSPLFTYGDKKLTIRGTTVDPDFLTMFGFPFVEGDLHTALDRPDKIVLTQKSAKALFGDEDPMGKTVRVDNQNNFTVSGVMQDLPNNTRFDFEYLMPWSFMEKMHQTDSAWDRNSTYTYVMLRPNADLAAFNKKSGNIYIEHSTILKETQSFLYPVSQLRLYSKFENGKPAGGRIERVRIFIVVAVFILLIACINFMNMSTARSEKRAKEVGIRKVSGAVRGSLIGQFLGESVLLAAVAGCIALLLARVSLPVFNEMTGEPIAMAFGSVGFWLAFVGFVLLTGVLAGSYPAFFLSNFQPVAVLKGSFRRAHALVTPRKVLVVLQFTFAMILIVCTMIIEKQVQYAQGREAGYDKNNMIYSFLSGSLGNATTFDAMRQEMIRQGWVTAVTKTSSPITASYSSGSADWSGKDPNDRTDFHYFNIDADITQTAGLQVTQGRALDPLKYPTDSTGVMLNEAAVKVMGFAQPIGQVINKDVDFAGWHVVGVVRNFVMTSPYDNIEPRIIQGPHTGWFSVYHMKLNAARPTAEDLAGVERVVKKYNPLYPWDYHFVDKEYEKKFADEKASGTLTAFFAGLTIFISCLGLLGLAAYMAESRTKEIGVRKVLGASVASIMTLLSKDFIVLVGIAIVVASPIAWVVMSRWLDGYAYHMPMPLWVFFVSGAGAVGIALVTVSVQAVRAAVENPVRSLRSE